MRNLCYGAALLRHTVPARFSPHLSASHPAVRAGAVSQLLVPPIQSTFKYLIMSVLETADPMFITCQEQLNGSRLLKFEWGRIVWEGYC